MFLSVGQTPDVTLDGSEAVDSLVTSAFGYLCYGSDIIVLITKFNCRTIKQESLCKYTGTVLNIRSVVLNHCVACVRRLKAKYCVKLTFIFKLKW